MSPIGLRPAICYAPGMMRAALALASFVSLLGCSNQDTFACNDDSECNLAGAAGYCDAPGYCSFDDPACPSGRRFGSLAGMGLSDECVPGDGTTGTGDPSADTTSTDFTTSGETTSLSTGSGSAGSGSGDETSSGGDSSESSSSSTGSSQPAMCVLYDFDRDPGFEDLGSSVEVVIADGRMTAQWSTDAGGTALLRVEDNADLSSGRTDVEFAAFPPFEGLVLASTWVDAEGHILSGIADGPSYAVSYYDPVSKETALLGAEAIGGREVLRMRAEGATVIVEAGAGESFEELAVVDQPFDLSSVDVLLEFDRYTKDGGAAGAISLESLTSCVSD